MQQRLENVVVNIAIDERHDDASHQRKLSRAGEGSAVIVPQHDTEINEPHHKNMPHLRPQASSSDSQPTNHTGHIRYPSMRTTARQRERVLVAVENRIEKKETKVV